MTSALLAVVGASFVGVFLGMRLANVLPAPLIKRVFAVMLFLTGIKYWFNIFAG